MNGSTSDTRPRRRPILPLHYARQIRLAAARRTRVSARQGLARPLLRRQRREARGRLAAPGPRHGVASRAAKTRGSGDAPSFQACLPSGPAAPRAGPTSSRRRPRPGCRARGNGRAAYRVRSMGVMTRGKAAPRSSSACGLRGSDRNLATAGRRGGEITTPLPSIPRPRPSHLSPGRLARAHTHVRTPPALPLTRVSASLSTHLCHRHSSLGPAALRREPSTVERHLSRRAATFPSSGNCPRQLSSRKAFGLRQRPCPGQAPMGQDSLAGARTRARARTSTDVHIRTRTLLVFAPRRA